MAERRASDAWVQMARKEFPPPKFKVLDNGDILAFIHGKMGRIIVVLEDVANLEGGENKAHG